MTDTGSSNLILGLDWLRHHNPLVNWSEGRLFFIQCPSSCNVDPNSIFTPSDSSPTQKPPTTAFCNEDIHLDSDHLYSLLESLTDRDIDSEISEFMSQELGPDETLLYVHLPANIPHVDSSHDSNCIRQLGVNSNPINQYMKDFSAVFAQSGFDELPPR